MIDLNMYEPEATAPLTPWAGNLAAKRIDAHSSSPSHGGLSLVANSETFRAAVDMLHAALDHAAAGRAVFPCGEDKKPLTPHGFYDATTDTGTIRQWWTRNPQALIGIPTGATTGIVVLDVDMPEGPGSLEALEAKFGHIPPTLEQQTRSGGRHIIFTHPGREVKNRASCKELGHKLDIRGDGGYIIAAPSPGYTSNGLDPAPLPEWLLTLLTKGKEKASTPVSGMGNSGSLCGGTAYGAAALEAELKELQATGEGGRNHRLNAAAFSLAQLVTGGELLHHEVAGSLMSAALQIGLDEKEALATIRSGMEAGAKDPRRPERDLKPKAAADQVEAPTQQGADIMNRLRTGAQLKVLDVVIEWLVYGIIPLGAVILFYARGGMGKSTIILQMVAALTRGASFFGVKTMAAPVIYVDYENPLAVLVDRCKRIDADEVFFLDSSSSPPKLDKPEWVQYLGLVKRYPGCVLVFDTLRSSHGKDENSAQEMEEIMGRIRQIRDAGCTVIVLHHTAKADETIYRGSTAIPDLADHIMAMYPVRKGTDQEIKGEVDAEGQVYRFGTINKTRYAHSKMYLSFDKATCLFKPAGDPTAEEMQIILRVVQDLHQTTAVCQKAVVDALKNTGCLMDVSEHNIRKLLKRGEGIHWTTRKGLHNKTIYEPVFQFEEVGASNCQTEVEG